jgi:aromatic ring-opening dioxygenase catalytic subunit (LigB family)
MGDISGPKSVSTFGVVRQSSSLVDRYNPKGIIVFSAHWDDPELLGMPHAPTPWVSLTAQAPVTDYKPENPLLYDYYGFPEQLYQITYRSRGSSELSAHIVETFADNGLSARTTPITEPRGRDGRRKNRLAVESGLDHGVFLPFKLMFPDTAHPDGVFPIPIVEVSMSSTFEPGPQWEIGAAIKSLREEGYLILAGGLTVHDFGDFSSFNSDRAKPVSCLAVCSEDKAERRIRIQLYHVWNDKIIHAINTQGTVGYPHHPQVCSLINAISTA